MPRPPATTTCTSRASPSPARPQGGAKLIQKALDRRHESAIKQFAKAKDEAALGALWDDAVKRGDIPGAYWAALSHPAATEAIMRRAFGDVHMLSHMVGAANRADIRRLRQLEEENAALSAKLEAQQRQLRDGFTARDEKIKLLNEALSRALAEAPVEAGHEGEDLAAARNALIDLDRRLDRETAHRARLEGRLDAADAGAGAGGTRPRRSRARPARTLRRELALAEAQINARGSGKRRPRHRTSPARRCSMSAAVPTRCRSSRPWWSAPAASSSITTAASSTAWPCCRA